MEPSEKGGKTMRKTCLSKLIAAVLVFAFVLTMFSSGLFNVSAASFSGKGRGTKTEPYIVETAQQLDEMRNNLGAYYELGNTIDLSAIKNFKPIGTIAKPFTGSFICKKNSDGTPKYIIKNLTIKVSPKGATYAEKYSGYKGEGTSGWEAAMFGAAKGSTFENIVVLDANVTSTVEGRSTMNADWSLNPGMDEQPTAVLLGWGENVTVTGCGASGKVTSASNATAGLISRIKGHSRVKYSYSYVDVTTTGCWVSGGFIAVVGNGSEVSYCFYDGTFTGGATEDGAFFGSANGQYEGEADAGKVNNCWAGGTVTSESSGCFGGAKDGSYQYADYIEPYKYVENCYTIAVIKGRKKAPTNKRLTNGNYISDQVGGLEIGFAAASQAEINKAFSGDSKWVIKEGTYPQIKDISPVKDASKYKPLAKTEETPSANNSSSAINNSNSNASNDATTSAESTGNTSSNNSTDTQNSDESNKTETSQDEGLKNENENGDSFTAVVVDGNDDITLSEKILIGVLSALLLITIALTIWTLILIITYLKKKQTSYYSEEIADVGEE